jgi:hypothetical protein
VWAHAAALVVTSLASAALFSFRITLSFVCGCVIVKLCCYLYHAAADEDADGDEDGGHERRGDDDRDTRAASLSAYAPVNTDGRADAARRSSNGDDDGDIQSTANEMAIGGGGGGGARYVSVSVRDQDANGVDDDDDSDGDDNVDDSDRMGGDGHDDIDDLGFGGGGRGDIGLARTSPLVGANRSAVRHGQPSPLVLPPFAPAAAAAASLRFSSPGLVGHGASGARSSGSGTGGKFGGGGSSALKPAAHSASPSASGGEIEM